MRRLTTVIPFGFEFDPARYIAAYKTLGCTGAQLYRNVNQPPTIGFMREVIRDAGLSYDSIHGVFGESIDPSSPDPAHRAHCLRLYEDEARLALDLGGPMAVVHPSANLPGYRVMAPDEAEAMQSPRWANLDDFMRRLADLGERTGVTFLIENLPRMFPLGHDPAELSRRVLAVGSAKLRMCFDTGHAHMVGDVPSLLEACAPAISYLHVHDNDSKVDNHRMPGDGTIEWARVADILRRTSLDVSCMLEVFYPEAEVERRAMEGLAPKLAAACSIT